MKRLLISIVVTACVADLVRADEAVRSLQQTLKTQGFYYGTVTGERTAETISAIRRYQIRNGLKVTGEINEETLHSLASTSNSVAATSRPNSKAATRPDAVRPDASLALNEQSRSPSTSRPDRASEIGPSYPTSFYQPALVRVNRRTIAVAQSQLMSRGYYRGRLDGQYGSQTAFAVCAFQSSAGLPVTGRLDAQTIDALGLADSHFAYSAPVSAPGEVWIPVRKFKHGKWKVKWKSHERAWGDYDREEHRQVNSDYNLNGYDDD